MEVVSYTATSSHAPRHATRQAMSRSIMFCAGAGVPVRACRCGRAGAGVPVRTCWCGRAGVGGGAGVAVRAARGSSSLTIAGRIILVRWQEGDWTLLIAEPSLPTCTA